MRVYSDITQTIGNTPLVELKSLNKSCRAKVLLKLEFFNPMGSVKDRIGKAMIEDAEANGVLQKGMTIIEPTSGNTGIALAFVAAAKGYKLVLTMPETMSQERRTLLLMLGAELVLTPGPLGMKGAIAKALELKDLTPHSWMPSQFANPANPEIHRKTTALEIWNDTEGTVDIVVSGVGTAGTLTGVGQVLKRRKPTVQMIAVEPSESPVLAGGTPAPHKIQGIGPGFIPSIMDKTVMDSVSHVSSEEAIAFAKKVIREEGIPVGISSGAAILAAIRLAECPENEGKVIVVIVPSSTERYLSTLLADDERKAAMSIQTSEVKDEYLKKATQ